LEISEGGRATGLMGRRPLSRHLSRMPGHLT
jgi:hypothetical protein